MRLFAGWGFSALGLLFCVVSTSQALDIDNFDDGSHAAVATAGTTDKDVLAAAVLGGVREIDVTTLSGSSIEGEVVAPLGLYFHSQNSSTSGNSLLIWDGDPTIGLNETGLGGVDLINNDGSDSFELVVEGFDYPGNKSVDLTLTVYDASDPTGFTWSSAKLTLNAFIGTSTIFTIPYADFITTGPGGGADFTNVGAITLYINGASAPAADLEIDALRTNGECVDVIPEPGIPAKDDCGVCGGDNSTCLDCKGVVNGPAKELRCGCEDDTSCLDCKDVDISEKQFVLDGTAKKQERHINKMLKRLLELSQSKATKNFVSVTKKTAHALQVRNWILSWTMPSVTLQCTNKAFCVDLDTDNDEILTEYRKHSDELRDLGIEAMKRVEKIIKTLTPGDQRLLKKNLKLHATSYSLADSIPLTVSYCF